jgi:hypothetical protein
MAINRGKISFEELQRARQSGMLVDLRYVKEEKKDEPLKKQKKAITLKNHIKFDFSLLFPKKNLKTNKNKVKKFISGLLVNEGSNSKTKRKNNHSALSLRNIGFSLKKKKNIKELIIKDSFKFNKQKKKNKVWLKVVKEKERILGSHFRPGKKRYKIVEEKLAWYRSLFSFALILLFLVVPLKLLSFFQILDIDGLENKIMVRSNAAISQLEAAAHSVSQFDFKTADQNFSSASQEFLRAEEELSIINNSLLSLASLSNNPKYKLASESKNILAAGTLGSSMGQNLVLATNRLFNYQESDNFLEAMQNFSFYGSLAYEDSSKLSLVIAKINENNLPSQYRKQFVDLKSKVEFLSTNLKDVVSMVDKLYALLGKTQDKRYLLIFQNNAELRASGGFLGSYALIDVRNGKIKNMEVPAGGSYDTEGGMTVSVKAPEPLWLVNPLWHFWDANWWPDWPTTAQNLMWFYEKSGGSTVDGVITFTPTVVERLLDITGPIDMSLEYGVVIDSANFWETTQKIVEHDNLLLTHPEETVDFQKSSEEIVSSLPLYQDLENNSENKPKKIIGDLMARILEILPEKLNEENLVNIISLFEDSVQEKQIMLYFSDSDLQKEAISRNLAGELKSSDRDYLLVVNTNIAGQKTDRKMSEKIEHLSQVEDSGRIIDSLKILRYHEGLKNEALTGVRNVNWLRVYVPLGSRLISASGFSVPDASYFEEPQADWLDSDFLQAERLAVTDPLSGLKIYQENGKTVYAGWVMTDPGQIADIRFSYELPFNIYNKQQVVEENFWQKIDKLINHNSADYINYSLLVQKQPGAQPSSFSSKLILPNSVKLVWQHPKEMSWQSGWVINDQLDRDRYYSLLLNNTYDK